MLTREHIAEIAARYDDVRPGFDRLAAEVGRRLNAALRSSGRKNLVSWRAKWPDSLARKLWKERDRFELADFRASLAPPLRDLAGARVLVYRPADVAIASDAIKAAFPGCTQTPRRTAQGYAAEHFGVSLDRVPDVDDALADLRRLPCEVQLCTVTQHVWNELEHDIIYKQPDGQPDAGQRELLASLHAELALAASTVERLMTRSDQRRAENEAPITSPEDLRRWAEQRYNATMTGDFGALLRLLSLLLRELTGAALDRLLGEGRSHAEAEELARRFDLDGSYGEVGVIAVRLVPALGLVEILDLIEDAETEAPPLWRFLGRVASDGRGR
jgi:ppGpp synthetase/RelA/SpoT-type nucleotidyltranferase